jgi:hypothetical protein
LATFLTLALLILLAPVHAVIAATPANTTVTSKGTLSVDPVSGPPGTEITITGSRYSADSNFKLFRDTALIANEAVNTEGAFTAVYSMPTLPAGTYKFTATTTAGDTTETAAIFTITPKITTGNSSGKVGDPISINGQGFQKSGVIAIYFDSSSSPIISPKADTTGCFNSSFSIPDTYQGTHTVIGKDTINYTSCLDFNLNPIIKVVPINTATDSQIAVSGSGFSRTSTISFYLDSEKLAALASSTPIGNFASVKVAIPSISNGSHTLKVMDSKGFSDSSKITVTFIISISPTNGPAGTQITIKGGGFASNSRVYILYQDQRVTTEPPVIVSDDHGNFTASIQAPSSSAGSFTIQVTDGNGICSSSFVLTTSAQLGKSAGTVGSEIPVSGTGFKAGTNLNIKFDTNTVASVSVGSNGSFATSFKVPPSLPGQHKVIVTDYLNPSTLSFFTEASAQISTPTGTGNQVIGNVGSPITINGSGFSPGGTVDITYDSELVEAATVDEIGSFSAVFKAPVSEGGNHIVMASDGVNEFFFVFVMEATSPPTPMCLFPLKDEKGDALTMFQWVGVSDPSGVTYRFQLSKDPSFKTLLMDKKDLTGPSYQLIPEEKLKAGVKNQRYYWRVQAIDKASNVSSWSEASSFYVGFIFPFYFLYGFCGLVGLIIFAGGLVIGTLWGAKFTLFSRFKKVRPEESTEIEEAANTEA